MERGKRYVAVLLVSCTAAFWAACGSSSSEFGPNTGGDGDASNGSSGSLGSIGGGDGDGGASDGGGFDPDAACATSTVEAKRAPANILFIIDRSGSMNCNPPPTTDSATCEQFPVTADSTLPSKWSITRDALKSAIAAMPATNSVGLTYFNVDNDCGVQATPSVAVAQVDATQQTLLEASLDGVQPQGLTPIVGGVTLGYQYLHANTFTGKKFLVLITDGAETCAPEQQGDFVATTVTNAALVGIRTFVIGAPGSEGARAFLSQVAWNGQTAKSATCTHAAAPANVGDCHFDLTNASTNLAAQLNAALDQISREALGCEYDVPSPSSGTLDYDLVNVIYDPSNGPPRTLKQDTSKPCAGGADGWQYSSDRKKIFLCGAACTAVKSDPNGNVSIALGCATDVK
ncbi:MAG: VWA domain-containing protein [Labilithrix sp.]|nr:VWA domain-containing protein [Labilithrix sp.]MCW5831274.1 VWA domain-containing protein [Labilithrix sp.]